MSRNGSTSKRETERYQWAWRLTSFEFRFALWLVHALPRGHEARREMAECILRIRKANQEVHHRE